jgi:hypothetical protein
MLGATVGWAPGCDAAVGWLLPDRPMLTEMPIVRSTSRQIE